MTGDGDAQHWSQKSQPQLPGEAHASHIHRSGLLPRWDSAPCFSMLGLLIFKSVHTEKEFPFLLQLTEAEKMDTLAVRFQRCSNLFHSGIDISLPKSWPRHNFFFFSWDLNPIICPIIPRLLCDFFGYLAFPQGPSEDPVSGFLSFFSQ